jgi:hypothetical protein
MCSACRAANDVLRTNKAMCAACGWRDGGTCKADRRGGAALNVAAMASGTACPLGRHTSFAAGGVVTWKGWQWFGVPSPVRVELVVRGVKLERGEPLPGCGCSVRLKGLAQRLGVVEEAEGLAAVCLEWWAGVRKMAKLPKGQRAKLANGQVGK